MNLLDLNVGIKLDNTKQVLKFIQNENADICTFQESMNAVDDSVYDIFKSKNDIIKLEEYQYNEFAPLFIAEGITKNMANGLDTKEVARLIKFIIDTPSDVMIPELGIKNINN